MKKIVEQAGSSNGGQRPSLNSGFHPRRGWPIRSPKYNMKRLPYVIATSIAMMQTSCYYRTHMQVTSSPVDSSRIITMQVGDTRKIMSKTILTEISPGFMLGPANQLSSSDTNVIKIQGRDTDSVAWVQAIAPGPLC